MTVRELRRILVDDLERYEAAGWSPAIVRDGAIGVDVYGGGTIETTLVVRPVDEEAEERHAWP